ncbi:MAG: hypothetical protein PF590_01715 [Candidatus Delongbacteria bacterium]|nr:hypothetical protein [Candidatus Delongbacteria bacterium]
MKTQKNLQEEILYKETQQQRQSWIFLLIVLLFLLSLVAVIQQNILGVPFGNHPLSDTALWFMPLIPVFLLAFLYINRLDTVITKKGVWLKYEPYHGKYRFFPWSEIEKAYVRIYQPMKEYGGYGIRLISAKSSGAYNVSGKTGLQLIFKNGRHLLIGTQKGGELKSVIRQHVTEPHNN